MLFDGKDKYIINGNYYEVYLKSAKNSYADIKVYGGKKESNNRFKWKIESVNEENAHFFIHNNHKATESDDYYLYLAVSTDKDGDQAAWVGLNNINHAPANETYQWDILCMINPDRIYFKFINREYHSKYLKLVENKDSYGDRKAMGSTFTDNINYKRNWWAQVQA